MTRLLTLTAAAAFAALAMSLAPTTTEAQSASSCPIADQCRTQCAVEHNACRKDKFSPIIACEQRKQQCLTRCLQLSRNCGPRPTQPPGTRRP